jgi:hypothetical protein
MDKKLESYSKAEIIQAIRAVPKYMINGLKAEKLVLDQLDVIKRDKVFAEAQMARQTAIDRMNEFFNWQKEMIKKYGNGERVHSKDLPRIELERGAKLQNAWLDSEKARNTAEKQEDEYYGY